MAKEKRAKQIRTASKRSSQVDDLRPEEAVQVLRRLLDRGGNVAEIVRAEMEQILDPVECEAVASDVFCGLEALDVEELWDRSGPSRYGYQDPADVATEMIEEVLEPYVARMRQYYEFGKEDSGDQYALGILQGIYAFHHEAETEFKDSAPDDAGEAFHWVLEEWKKVQNARTARARMRTELAQRCPAWATGKL